MRDLLAITKALADRNRVAILLVLEGRELCVCQIIEIIRLAPSTVSKHLSILRQSRLIEDRKDGRWMYYRLAGQDAPAAVREAIRWVLRSIADTTDAGIYKERLQKILEIAPGELCKGADQVLRLDN
ncbi:MAG: metalloregulator ArsR/SmtB family transcription factor [Syntrophobacteraceae bacterium]|nr:metalloregulator ArsR/SmtB family transcription factor [Syntrophobacteraceae bacterium]